MTDLLKNKSRPEAAAKSAREWVESERAMREKLAKERQARELKEKLEVSSSSSFPYPIHIDYPPALVLPQPTQCHCYERLTLGFMHAYHLARAAAQGAPPEGEGRRRAQEATRRRRCEQSSSRVRHSGVGIG